jgi:hypothetical protein
MIAAKRIIPLNFPARSGQGQGDAQHEFGPKRVELFEWLERF